MSAVTMMQGTVPLGRGRRGARVDHEEEEEEAGEDGEI